MVQLLEDIQYLYMEVKYIGLDITHVKVLNYSMQHVANL